MKDMFSASYQARLAKFNNCPVLSINGAAPGIVTLYMGTDKNGGFEIGQFNTQRDAKSYARNMAKSEPLFIREMWCERGVKNGDFHYVSFV